MKDSAAPSPMEILQTASPEGAKTYLEHRASIMENPELQAVPIKYKLLVGIGVAAALELLGEAPQMMGWVIPSPKNPDDHLKDLKGPWRRMKALAEAQQEEEIKRKALRKRDRVDLSDVRIHDLRHSFASLGAGAGLGLPLIGQLLGHTQAQTTSRYAHLATDPLRAAADVVASRIVEAMEPKD